MFTSSRLSGLTAVDVKPSPSRHDAWPPYPLAAEPVFEFVPSQANAGLLQARLKHAAKQISRAFIKVSARSRPAAYPVPSFAGAILRLICWRNRRDSNVSHCRPREVLGLNQSAEYSASPTRPYRILPFAGLRPRIFAVDLLDKNGAQGRDRTTDTAIFSRMLYQLSYLGTSNPRTGSGAPVYSQAGQPCPPTRRQPPIARNEAYSASSSSSLAAGMT
jgi:hypothetical protein